MLIVLILVLAIAFCEASVLLLGDRRYAAQPVIALVVACALFVSWLVLENPWQVFPDKKFASVLLGVWIATVPVAVLSVLAFGFSRICHAFWRHLGVLLASGGVVYLYPWFALLSVCASGLDCI